MFESEQERSEKAFGYGDREKRSAGFWDEASHELKDILGTVQPSSPENDAYEAGWHNAPSERDFSSRSDSDESQYEGSGGYDSSSYQLPTEEQETNFLIGGLISGAITWYCVSGIMASPPLDADNLLRFPIAVIAGLCCFITMSLAIEDMFNARKEAAKKAAQPSSNSSNKIPFLVAIAASGLGDLANLLGLSKLERRCKNVAIHLYAHLGYYSTAAKLAERAGRVDCAIRYWVKNGNNDKAERLREQLRVERLHAGQMTKKADALKKQLSAERFHRKYLL